jgi:hypothetical protein
MKDRYPGFPLNKRLIEAKEYGDCSFKLALLIVLQVVFVAKQKPALRAFVVRRFLMHLYPGQVPFS